MTDMPELENLDDISYSELMKISVSEIPGLCPEWTDHNAHDPGITFLEMLMWLTEMQRYYLSQITESHLRSYLRLIGTEAGEAEPTVILARFFAEGTVSVKKGSVFYIGDIPYKPTDDMIIAPDINEAILCDGSGVVIMRDLAPFKGKILPIYFSSGETNANPMREGFYPGAEIKARLSARDGEAECPVNDGTYGLYQSGFINISLPSDFDEETAALTLDIISDDDLELPSQSRFYSDIRELIQLGNNGSTLGAGGRVKENVSFSAEISGQRLEATVFKEIRAGRNSETPQDAFKRFKAERERLPRAVSREDYARLVFETPGLRAELVNVFSKETGKVSVCVKTPSGVLRANEIKNLRKVLFWAKPVGTEIEILTPVVCHAKLVITAKTDGWAGGKKLTEHIRDIFKPLEDNIGALIDMPGLYKQIGASPIVSEMKSMLLRLGKGVELSENDTLKLPEDGLLSLDEIIIQ